MIGPQKQPFSIHQIKAQVKAVMNDLDYVKLEKVTDERDRLRQAIVDFVGSDEPEKIKQIIQVLTSIYLTSKEDEQEVFKAIKIAQILLDIR